MTPRQIILVQNSWRTLRHVEAQLIGDLFYTKLFFDHPELRRMFPADLSLQYQKLMQMLQVIVARLGRFDELEQHLADLAKRHVGYGVAPEQYRYIGNALMWTLEHSLDPDWTPETADAWKTCYRLLSQTMINAVATPA